MSALGEVIAVIRGGRAPRVVPVCLALIDAGVTTIEVTTNTPGWQTVIATISEDPRAHVGVGTALTGAQVESAARAGARFVVSPHTDLAVGAAARHSGLAWYPGALTPTEIVAAHASGADAVKVFPANAVGGPSFLAAVHAPLPHIPLIPTGGIGVDRIADYLAVGALAVGVGAPLLGDALEGGSLLALADRARRALGAEHA